MTNEQTLIIGILIGTVALFLWGRWRHDMVAVGALLACVLGGLVSAADAFAGFGHPAVVTVACVLILSHGLQQSGAVDVLVRHTLPTSSGPTVTIAALTALAAVVSGFMNNIGALALLMPVALQVATRQKLPAGRVLMPLAFGSILGGMTTMIGTPPNLIVSGFRAQTGAGTFGMFDFTPVGLAVAVVGVAFVALLGWRLVPARERAGTESFETGAYITEARVPDKSKAVEMTLRQLEGELDEVDAQVVGLVRNEVRVTAPNPRRVVRAGDILIIEAEADALTKALSTLGLELEEAVHETAPARTEAPADESDERASAAADEPRVHHAREATGARNAAELIDNASGKRDGNRNTPGKAADQAEASTSAAANSKHSLSYEVVLSELAVLPQSELVGRSASEVGLRSRYGVNLLAVSRQGSRSMARLRTMVLHAGDVLLMQGAPETLAEFANDLGCAPLAERALHIPDKRKMLIASTIMALAVAAAAFGLLPAAVSFTAAVLASMALRSVPLRSVYQAIDWPVIVLLAALIPVAGAMASTGTADLIAHFLLETLAQGHAVVTLALILIVTMTLSDVMNNAATAAVMSPIAIGAASQLGVSSDPFLMAVAVGASCAFLTPIGHQNNTLILGPGGFRFGDYWRLGLPLEILVVAVGIPMLLLVWPL